MVDLKAAIAKQRAKLEAVVSENVDIVVGDDLVTVTVERVHPDVWDALMQANPRRQGSDTDDETGYNTKGVTLAYPRLLVDGEVLGKDEVAALFAVLDSSWRNALSIVIWGVNVNHSLQEMRALGKGRAGRMSPSPAN